MSPYAWLGIVIAVLAAESAVFYAGGLGPRAELAKHRAEVLAAKKLHDAEDAKRTAETKTVIIEKDAEHEKVLLAVSTAWSAEYQRLHDDRDRLARAGAKPARIVAGVCNNADGNRRLSDALEKAERGIRERVADYQGGTGKLLEVCQRQTASWDNLKSALAGIKAVNR